MRLLLLSCLFLTACITPDSTNKESLAENATKAVPLRDFPVNKDIKPCQDFYQYACSKVMEDYELRPDRSRHIFSFNDSSDRILEFKKSYFKNLDSRKPESEKEAELKNVYMACMDDKSRSSEEVAYVEKIKAEAQAFRSKQSFQVQMAQNVLEPNYSFISFHDLANLDEPLNSDLFKSINLLTLPDRSYYENEELMKDYRVLVEDFFSKVGLDNPAQRAEQVVSFEKAMGTNFPYRSEMRELFSKKNLISKEQMLKKYPELHLEIPLQKVPSRTQFRSIWPKSIEHLNKALNKASLEELKNLYVYFSLYNQLDEAYPEYFQHRFGFQHKHLGGPEQRTARQERCTEYVISEFGKELDYVIVPLMFPGFPKEDFIRLAEKVRGSLLQMIEENKWLTASARKEATRKIKTADMQLVTPDNEEEWDFVPGGDYSDKHYIANAEQRNSLEIQKMLDDLSKKANPRAWHMGPLTVNAYYSASFNKFVMLLGILQYPFYSPDSSEIANLGAIGAVVGHELGHAVDDYGSKYNADGQLKTWFTPKDQANYDKRVQKLIDQWNELGEDGKFKLGENIGDLVGVTSAYRAAFPEGTEVSRDKQQEFFLQYARAWCGEARPKMAERLLKTDSHSSVENRVNGQMKHQAGFAEAYQCKPGDPMTLPDSERIKVW